MALYLIQHGKSLQKDKDPEQGLSEEGMREVERIAKVAAEYGIRVSVIKHSGKKRARQTAEIFSSRLAPEISLSASEGMNPLDDVRLFAAGLDARDNAMLVGHLPFMERLTSYLIAGSTDKLVFKFQNGGIVCLDKDPETNAWFIKWTLMPRIE